MKRRPEWYAAVTEGCRESRRARDARARAERAARALVDGGYTSLLTPMLRDSKLDRVLSSLASTVPGLAAVRPRSVVVYWRRNPAVLAAVLGESRS
jgi:hypothetical protein